MGIPDRKQTTEENMVLFSEEAATCVDCQGAGFAIEHDLIRGPGKFEGEPLAAYHAYHTYLDGGTDDDVYFANEQQVSRVGNVLFEISESGFIYTDIYDTEEEAIARIAELEAEAASETEDEEETN